MALLATTMIGDRYHELNESEGGNLPLPKRHHEETRRSDLFVAMKKATFIQFFVNYLLQQGNISDRQINRNKKKINPHMQSVDRLS